MKTPIRFQSRLLIRRSYKPGRFNRRALGVTFRPVPRFEVKVAQRKEPAKPEAAGGETLAQSE
jgi:hypothetical protein